MRKQIKTHFVGKLIVKVPSLVKHSVHVFPLLQLLIVVESADLHFVKPVILSPVWSCLEFFKEFVFHHLLKLFSSESSGEEWYLKWRTVKEFLECFTWRHVRHIDVPKKQRSCWCPRPILWMLNLSLRKNFLWFQKICIASGYVSEKALLSQRRLLSTLFGGVDG